MKTLLIVDVSNIYFSAKYAYNGGRIDYTKLKSMVDEPYRAIAYGSLNEDSASFINMLKALGFETVFKEPKTWTNTDGSINKKADLDVKMAVDVMACIDKFDQLTLCSADGDLAPLVEHVRQTGVRVTVAGINISRDLKDAANYFIELDSNFLVNNATSSSPG